MYKTHQEILKYHSFKQLTKFDWESKNNIFKWIGMKTKRIGPLEIIRCYKNKFKQKLNEFLKWNKNIV